MAKARLGRNPEENRQERLARLNKFLAEFKTIGGQSLSIDPTPVSAEGMNEAAKTEVEPQGKALTKVLGEVFTLVGSRIEQNTAEATAAARQFNTAQEKQAPEPPDAMKALINKSLGNMSRSTLPSPQAPGEGGFRMPQAPRQDVDYGWGRGRAGQAPDVVGGKDLTRGGWEGALNKLSEGLGELPSKMGELGQMMGQFGINDPGLGKVADLAEKAGRAAEGDPTAIAALVKEGVQAAQRRVAQIWEETAAAANSAWKAAASERAGDVMANAFDVLGHEGAAIGGETGQLIQRFAALGRTVGVALERLRGWNENLHRGNMQFAEFSGGMSMVQAEQEVRDIMLSQRRGDRRAASARALAESKSSLDARLAPFEDILAVIKNAATAVVNNKSSQYLEGISKLAEDILAKMTADESGEEINAGDWMSDVAEQKWYETYGRPERGGR